MNEIQFLQGKTYNSEIEIRKNARKPGVFHWTRILEAAIGQ